MNPTPIEPNNESTTPEENSVPVTPLTPFEPETTETQVTPETVPVEPMTLTSPDAEQVPTTQDVPVAPSDIFFPTSPQPVPLAESTPVTAPIGSGEAVVPTPEPKKTDKKKLILIAGVIGGVVLLAIVGVILYLALMTVSKKDYAEAATQYNTLSSANSTLVRGVSSLSSGVSSDEDDEYNETLKEAETSLETLKSENEKLGDLKATRVGDGKELYAAFDSKLNTYAEYAGSIIGSVKTARPALFTCAKVSDTKDTASRLAALKECSTALDAVKDIPNAEFKTFADSLKAGYAKYVTTYTSYVALTDPLGAQYEQYKELRDEITATQKDLSTAAKDFSAAVKKHDEEVSVKDSANALGKYFTEQQK